MGFSASSTSNPQTTTNYQLTGSGASGNASPTAVAGGNVDITDAGQTANAINAVASIASQAIGSSLGMLSTFNANQANTQVQQTQDETDLLSTLLSNNQTLAENVQSGGATTGMDLTTKVVYGALALGALLIALLMFRK
jgi:hypothetical protein